ncbi:MULTISPECIES: hypothetical protein [Pseudomonas]|nr:MULTISPECIES: hypothetical protein [Pseudomonas]KWS96896.1 hypothetical protein AL048_17225 [Pseudomonas syringae pv. castaneae]MBN4175587.1 hypothetical protein [Pseudomonas savastanoi pv. phaseolicola]MCF5167548.1 hypothetical protein [Pseudomonas congelans]RMT13537.1 hypothetical protein ALP53_01793 [Pseudomonas savastanoi pv. phaseolicola]
MSEDDNSPIIPFRDKANRIKDKDRSTGPYKVREAQNSGDLDTTLTLRINSRLKSHFEELCKSEHTTLSREVKRYITEAVRTQTLI